MHSLKRDYRVFIEPFFITKIYNLVKIAVMQGKMGFGLYINIAAAILEAILGKTTKNRRYTNLTYLVKLTILIFIINFVNCISFSSYMHLYIYKRDPICSKLKQKFVCIKER